MPEQEGLVIDIVCLRRDMNGNIRAEPFRAHEHARICYQQSVGLHDGKLSQIVIRLLKVLVVGEDIDSHIDLNAMGMGIIDALAHLLRAEVFSLCPKREGLSADIDRVRPVADCNPQNLRAGSRYQ